MTQTRKLEWFDYNDAIWGIVPFGRYIVWSNKGKWWMEASFDGTIREECKSREEAKLAAQADFERRVSMCFADRNKGE